MSYHVDRADDAGVEAAREVIGCARPDVLVLQGPGAKPVFETVRETWTTPGTNPIWEEVLEDGRTPGRLAILSRFPIAARHSRKDLGYRIKEDQLFLRHGIADVTLLVSDQVLFRLVAVDLKDKVFHRLGQTEMRRNECRLVARHLRKAVAGTPGARFLLAGTFNDRPDSAAVSEILKQKEPALSDVRPVDEHGDAWTAYNASVDEYYRHDYFFVVAALAESVVRAQTRVVDHPRAREASTRRALLVTLRIPKE